MVFGRVTQAIRMDNEPNVVSNGINTYGITGARGELLGAWEQSPLSNPEPAERCS